MSVGPTRRVFRRRRVSAGVAGAADCDLEDSGECTEKKKRRVCTWQTSGCADIGRSNLQNTAGAEPDSPPASISTSPPRTPRPSPLPTLFSTPSSNSTAAPRTPQRLPTPRGGCFVCRHRLAPRPRVRSQLRSERPVRLHPLRFERLEPGHRPETLLERLENHPLPLCVEMNAVLEDGGGGSSGRSVVAAKRSTHGTPRADATDLAASAYRAVLALVRSRRPRARSPYFSRWKARRAGSSMQGGVMMMTRRDRCFTRRTMAVRFSLYSSRGTVAPGSTFARAASLVPSMTVTRRGCSSGGKSSSSIERHQRVLYPP